MPTYTELNDLRTNAILREKAKKGLVEVAQYILDGGGGQPKWMNVGIVGNCRGVLFNGQLDEQVDRFMWHVALDPTIQANGEASTDAQVKGVVESKVETVWGQ